MNGNGTATALAVGTIMGLAGMAAARFVYGAERFWIDWNLWFFFILTIGLGSLFLVALEHTVGAKWSVPLRRVPERLSGLVVLMAPAALAALFSIPFLYPWSRPEGLADPVVAGKAGWLNVPFFTGRVVFCVAVWLLSYRLLVGGSVAQDQSGNPRFNLRARRFAPLFMALFAITITVAGFDWISSLEPEWYSDIFGVYVFAGTFLAGLAATTLAVLYLKRRGRLEDVGPDHLYNLGGFLFAFIVFWSYIGFAQYLLMWYANMPEEVFWYRERLAGGWLPLVLAMALFHFFVPFFLLIPRESKSRPKLLARAAALVLIAHWLDLYWMMYPVLGIGPRFGWPELSFALFFVSASLLWVRRAMRLGADMPVGDPFLEEGLGFRL